MADALTRLPDLLQNTGLVLRPDKTRVWAPDPPRIREHPKLWALQATMVDRRGLTMPWDQKETMPSPWRRLLRG